jgi:hypothetical protein
MRKFHSVAALCGDGLRPELKALFDRLAVDPHSELFVRPDGMTQAGPDPVSETAKPIPILLKEWPSLKLRVAYFGRYLRLMLCYFQSTLVVDPSGFACMFGGVPP